jgi:hypothetical protein
MGFVGRYCDDVRQEGLSTKEYWVSRGLRSASRDLGIRLLLASGSCVAGPRVPLALGLRASCPSQRSVPPPCRPGVAKQVRLGRRRTPGGSLWVAWVVRVSLSRSTQRYPGPPDQTPTHASAGKRSCAKETRSPSTLAAYSQTHSP